MAALMIRNLSDELHRALAQRAKNHGRSTQAEIRAILQSAVEAEEDVRMGTALAAVGERLGGLDLNIERDQTPAEAAHFD